MNTIPNKQTTEIDDQLRPGNWFFFEYQGHEVVIYLYDPSGRVVVYVDEQVVLDQRRFRINPMSYNRIHTFRMGDKDFRLVFNRSSIFQGRLKVGLFQDSELIGEEEKILTLKMPFGQILRGWKVMFYYFATSFVTGFITVQLMNHFF
jgi:hypothetical protein